MKRRKTRKNKHPACLERIKNSIGKIGTLNIVLICVFAYMIYINWKMLDIFLMCGSAPETAWCSLIAALLGECGICGWIKTSKEKHRNRGTRDGTESWERVPDDYTAGGMTDAGEYCENEEDLG
ncbi:hypothetical protein BRYFOR_07562 [Marvinbryantia formatexigens DSM 14469]|uniref:Uncharacterized protein n=1 Tax=Marvinbryantia formatexigens DSM 14469 TaxID=478749 RepID=C6LG02_9FIRM|nr:hypothetical protein [Marvinbryantia formatexigens]EET60366.1 hypothetical protein BRYFOR_07562 [Marvinbryantia formatexigens DSM 14469]UWO25294.1 hypothetical protein NQ534_02025 [Marvinbryantia formatexigens DSM 14469]SDH41722.1 hypothetical protein SAMN05660368_04270 [Marvinbryantia formatexigens]